MLPFDLANAGGHWLTARAQATPHAPALIIGTQTWTYAQLEQRVTHWYQYLLGLRLTPGHKLAILMYNNLNYVCLLHAAARAHLTLIPLNTRLTPPEINWQLNHLNTPHAPIKALLHTPTFDSTINALTTTIPTISISPTTLPSITSPPDYPSPPPPTNQISHLLFTSGTTGHPKAVQLSFHNHFYSAIASAFRLGLQPHDRWLSCLPLYHVGGLAVIFRSCLYGTAVTLHQKFDLDAINHDLDTQPITLISLVPTMLYRLLNSRQTWPDSLRLVLLGGAAATPDLVHRAHAHNIPIATTYGLTEASSQVATMRPDDVLRKPGSVGRPLLFTTVTILDDDGQPCPPNQYGELTVSGPAIMSGYYQNETATHKTLRDGRLHTGDIGYLDEDGDLWLVQRRSDIIITGGENVYPAEVERLFLDHPAVAAICVVGLPHPEWGQQVAALIVPTPDAPPPAQLTPLLLTHARHHLASYKLPRTITYTDHLPQTANGKIHRPTVVTHLQQSP
ncbi:MAG TPA: o-succinylbenzoate--CoA ligase [Anaerolineae bacterium]|nr:o-succinylbenzoate--CoA ligase [Anaerolineae bacterium]